MKFIVAVNVGGGGGGNPCRSMMSIRFVPWLAALSLWVHTEWQNHATPYETFKVMNNT